MKDKLKSIELEDAYNKTVECIGLPALLIENHEKEHYSHIRITFPLDMVNFFLNLGFPKKLRSYFFKLSIFGNNVRQHFHVGVRNKISRWLDRVSKSLISSIATLFRTLPFCKFIVYFLSRSELKRLILSETGKEEGNDVSRSLLSFRVRGFA